MNIFNKQFYNYNYNYETNEIRDNLKKQRLKAEKKILSTLLKFDKYS